MTAPRNIEPRATGNRLDLASLPKPPAWMDDAGSYPLDVAAIEAWTARQERVRTAYWLSTHCHGCGVEVAGRSKCWTCRRAA